MVGVLAAIAALLYPIAILLSRPQILSRSMYALMALLIVYIVIGCLRRGDRVQTQRYVALLLLFVALVLFWALSLQGVTSLNFFARDHVSAPFDYTLFQSANPLYILIFAPLLALLWPWLARHGKDPSTPAKFGIGLLLVALSYGLMAVGIETHHGRGWQGRLGCAGGVLPSSDAGRARALADRLLVGGSAGRTRRIFLGHGRLVFRNRSGLSDGRLDCDAHHWRCRERAGREYGGLRARLRPAISDRARGERDLPAGSRWIRKLMHGVH